MKVTTTRSAPPSEGKDVVKEHTCDSVTICFPPGTNINVVNRGVCTEFRFETPASEDDQAPAGLETLPQSNPGAPTKLSEEGF